jgi:hypothetical protein
LIVQAFPRATLITSPRVGESLHRGAEEVPRLSRIPRKADRDHGKGAALSPS